MRLMLVAAAALLGAGCEKQKVVEAKPQSGPVKVTVEPVRSRTVLRSVESVGTLYPFDETIISSEADGQVLKVNADLGDSVRKGQLLVQLSDEESRYLLAQNEAQLRSSLERLGLKSETDKVQDMKQVADIRRAQANLTDTEQRYQRARSLVDQGIAAQADLDQAAARLKTAQAEYDQTVNSIRNLIRETERFKAVLDLQRKKLRDAAIYAPYDAAVKERTVNVGQFVKANTPLFTLVRTSPLRLRLEIPEKMAPWVREGQVAQVHVEAYEGKTFQGRVARISPTVDQAKRTFIVEAMIDNAGGVLKPGSYAKAILPTNKSEVIHLVPARSVVYLFGSNKAFVVKDGKIDAREVKLGDRFEQQVEIVAGLEPGEEIATSQLNRLDTGVKVQVVSAATSAAPGRDASKNSTAKAD